MGDPLGFKATGEGPGQLVVGHGRRSKLGASGLPGDAGSRRLEAPSVPPEEERLMVEAVVAVHVGVGLRRDGGTPPRPMDE
jgi:hypothetical protein